MTFTVEAATEYGAGVGPNGCGKRTKISGYYVVSPSGRRVRAFTGKDAQQKAIEWAKFCTANLPDIR